MSKMLFFELVSLQTGEEKLPGYLDAEQVLSWTIWKIEELQSGMHRSLRGKTLVTITTKAGSMNWTTESFHAVSAKILYALDCNAQADYHTKEAQRESTERLQSKFAV